MQASGASDCHQPTPRPQGCLRGQGRRPTLSLGTRHKIRTCPKVPLWLSEPLTGRAERKRPRVQTVAVGSNRTFPIRRASPRQSRSERLGFRRPKNAPVPNSARPLAAEIVTVRSARIPCPSTCPVSESSPEGTSTETTSTSPRALSGLHAMNPG